MGTLLGHALPGSFFLLFAVWRIIQISRRVQLLKFITQQQQHLQSLELRRRIDSHTGAQSRNRTPHDTESSLYTADNYEEAPVEIDDHRNEAFLTSATYPCCTGPCARWPIEGVVKLLVTSVGMAGELWASTDYGRAGHVVWMGDIQHVTMYSFFWLSGLVDVLTWKGVVWCVPGLDFITLTLAFMGEWLLFSNHTHGGEDQLNTLLHRLLLYAVAASAFFTLSEYKHPHSLVSALSTTFSLTLQGTWFFQTGLILYPPAPYWFESFYSLEVPNRLSMVNMIFAWHLAVDFVVLAVVYVLVGAGFRRFCVPSEWEHWDGVMLQMLRTDYEKEVAKSRFLKEYPEDSLADE